MSMKNSQEQFTIGLGQIARMWRAEIDRRLSSHGLTQARWLTLLHLSRMKKPVTQKVLAEAVGVQGPTLVRTLDWLEAEGLIARKPSTTDRREKSIHLLTKASGNLAQIQAVTENLRKEVFAGIDRDDFEACLRVFGKIIEKFHSHCLRAETREKS